MVSREYALVYEKTLSTAFFGELVEHVRVGVFLDAILYGLVVNVDGELHDMFHDYFPSFSISLIFSVRASSTSTRSPHLRFRQNCSRSAQFSACRMLRSLIA